jgi:hypothetical protein
MKNDSVNPVNERLKLEKTLSELSRFKDDVIKSIEWYKKQAPKQMVLFRTFGVLVILLSVSVPFLGTLEGLGKTIVLPVVSVLIAGLTGINAFFNWQSQWQQFRLAQFTLENLVAKWDFEILLAKSEEDEERAIEMVVEATKDLMEQASRVTQAETADFFRGVQSPST